MLKQTAEDYSQFLDLNVDQKLQPISDLVDDMLVRLEEFESMVAMVQQERCNSIGMTGALTQTVDDRKELKELCRRIDALETVIQHARSNIDVLETKVEAAEKHFGVVDNTTRLKSFLSPFFKRSSDVAVSPGSDEVEIFSAEKYFPSSQEEPESEG